LLKETRLAPPLTSPQLATALAHPVRAQALTILNDRIASPRELALEMDEPLNNVAYHVDVLVKLGCIELVRTEPRKGGRVVEHFYRATHKALLNDDEWNQLGDSEKAALCMSIMRLMSQDMTDAMLKGTFFDPDDGHLSRTPLTVDGEGWEEIKSVLDTAMESLLEIRSNVLARGNLENGEPAMHAKVNIIHFRSPTPGETA
jgi:DNA-binding transcriptional ArsR family regulator